MFFTTTFISTVIISLAVDQTRASPLNLPANHPTTGMSNASTTVNTNNTSLSTRQSDGELFGCSNDCRWCGFSLCANGNGGCDHNFPLNACCALAISTAQDEEGGGQGAEGKNGTTWLNQQGEVVQFVYAATPPSTTATSNTATAVATVGVGKVVGNQTDVTTGPMAEGP